LQTLWPAVFRRGPSLYRRRERIATPDGDFLDLDWSGDGACPVVILLHGLSGSSASPYILGLQRALGKRGFRSAALNFRGCSGPMNDSSRCYHSGETGDIEYVYRWLRDREPGLPIAAVGFSLGGNVLLKWLGETGGNTKLFAAVAVSVPLLLHLCATRMDRGFSRLYRNHLLRELRCYMRAKRVHLRHIRRWQEADRVERLGDLSTVRSFWDYDERVVAELYDFADAHDYYRKSSSRPFLRSIRTPTLVIQARDDPFMTPEVIPEPWELSESVHMEVTSGGGHVGFIAGNCPGRPRYWLEERIPAYLLARLGVATGAYAPVGQSREDRTAR
jgi:hypothetical protein